MKHTLVNRQPAQAVPLLALCLLLLLAFSGLAIDGAMAFAWRRNVTNSADASALIATRALIQDRGTVRGNDIYDAVHDYLQSELDVANPDFSVYYTDPIGQRMPVGSPLPISSTSTARPNPDTVRGVSVDVRYTFDTYLMRLLGRNTLTVGATATTRFGNAGTVTGAFVAPLALLPEAAGDIRNNTSTDYVLDLGGQIEANNNSLLATWQADPLYDGSDPPYPGWVDPDSFIVADRVRSIALNMGTAAPTNGTGGSCPPAGTRTLKGWWCNGTTDDISIRIANNNDQPALAQDLVGVAAFNANLVTNTFVGSREGKVIIVSVLNEPPDLRPIPAQAQYIIEYFLALEVLDVNPSNQSMTVRYHVQQVTNGGLMGGNNNVPRGRDSRGYAICEVCVVNLVRER